MQMFLRRRGSRPSAALFGSICLLLVVVVFASLLALSEGQKSEKEKLRERLAAFLKSRNKANDHGEDHRDEFKVWADLF